MQAFFQKLGLTDKESKGFLSLLEMGAQPISVLAKHIGVPRSSAYLITEKLKSIGLVVEFEKSGIKFVKCIPAREIQNILNIREQEIQNSKKLLEEILPDLEKRESSLSITPKIQHYEGKEAVKKMYEKILREKSFVAYFNPELVQKFMPEYHDTIPKTLKENRGEARELLTFSQVAQEYKQKYEYARHQIKILPKSISFSSDTIITSFAIYMVAYGENEVSAVEIINTELAKTQMMVFEELWGKY